MREKKSTFGEEMIAGLQELLDALKTGEPLEKHFTVRRVEIPEPPVYTARKVKALRKKLGVSQALFGQIVGVSKKLVEHWESGVRTPSPMACRLLDVIDHDPSRFITTVAA